MTDSIPLIPSLVIPAQTQLELRAPSASCLQSAKKKAGRQVSRSGCLNTSQQQEKLEEIAMMRATRIGGLIYPIYHLLRLVQPARFSISAFQGCNWDEEEKRQSRMRMQLGEQLLSTLCCVQCPSPWPGLAAFPAPRKPPSLGVLAFTQRSESVLEVFSNISDSVVRKTP